MNEVSPKSDTLSPSCSSPLCSHFHPGSRWTHGVQYEGKQWVTPPLWACPGRNLFISGSPGQLHAFKKKPTKKKPHTSTQNLSFCWTVPLGSFKVDHSEPSVFGYCRVKYDWTTHRHKTNCCLFFPLFHCDAMLNWINGKMVYNVIHSHPLTTLGFFFGSADLKKWLSYYSKLYLKSNIDKKNVRK